jgi:hypothetical protein
VKKSVKDVLFFALLILSLISSTLIWSPSANASAAGWEISMLVSGKKTDLNSNVSRRTALGSPGTSTFPSITSSNTGASSKTSFGNGEGLYSAFFNQKTITKVAFVDGSSSSLDPTQHNNYLIYDLVESTGNESIYEILKRLDEYQRTAALFQNNDSVWGSNSVLNHTAGYSGTLTASGGTGFRTSISGMPSATAQIPDRFALMGINRDQDNDIQAIAAYWGNLGTTSGKADSWRNNDPFQTFWSYWGNDFHASSQTQRIGSSLQTNPGVANGATWTGNVYFMTYSLTIDITSPTFTSSTSFSAAENIASSANAATIKVSESATVTISSGVDAALFNIVTSDTVTAFIRFKNSPNFESPSDNGGNNVYDLVLTATDLASNAGTQTITITVTDVVDTSAFNSFTLSGPASFRTVVTITANVTVASRVTFRARNVIIGGCKNKLTSGTAPNIVATCTWQPSTRGAVTLTATAAPTGAGISSATATPISVTVSNRSGSR